MQVVPRGEGKTLGSGSDIQPREIDVLAETIRGYHLHVHHNNNHNDDPGAESGAESGAKAGANASPKSGPESIPKAIPESILECGPKPVSSCTISSCSSTNSDTEIQGERKGHVEPVSYKHDTENSVW